MVAQQVERSVEAREATRSIRVRSTTLSEYRPMVGPLASNQMIGIRVPVLAPVRASIVQSVGLLTASQRIGIRVPVDAPDRCVVAELAYAAG